MSVCFQTIRAQEPVHRSYTSQNGLPSNEVYQVLQDAKGFIWFATNRGVSKFDGNEFRLFSIDNGLTDNSNIGLMEDSFGRIWCRSITGSFSVIEHDTAHSIEAHTKNYYPNSMFVDPQGVLWVGSQTGGIYYNIQPPYRESDVRTILDTTNDLHIVIRGNDLIYSRYSKLNYPSVIHDLSNENKIPFSIPPSEAGTRAITDGKWIIICSGHHVCIMDDQHRITQSELPFEVKNAYRDQEENLWLCLNAGGGVALFKNSDLAQTPQIFFDKHTISSVMQDHEGAYWFTSTTDGVRYVPSLENIAYDFSEIGNGEVIQCLGAYDAIVAANHSGQFLTVSSDGTILPQSGNYIKNPNSVPEGLVVINKTKKYYQHLDSVITYVTPSPDYYHLLEKTKMICKADATVCWGSLPLYCFEANQKTKSIERAYISPSRINDACNVGDTMLLLACNDGLKTFANRKFNDLCISFPELKTKINAVETDAHGRWWIATEKNGVFVIDGVSIQHIDFSNCVSVLSCNELLVSGENVYIATGDGIALIRRYGEQDVTCERLTIKNNHSARVTNALFKNEKGLYLWTDDGLFRYNDVETRSSLVPPPIYITNVSVNNQLRSILQNIILNFDQNNISISFVGPSFLQPGNNSFTYKLEGADNEWHNTSSTQIHYPALPPGNYTLSIFAINSLGVRSTNPAVWSFTISKPYWKEIWFIALIGLLTLGLAVWIALWRIKKIKQRAFEKEAVKLQMAGLELRALRAQMNPHFIFNCINSIQHYILENDKLLANKLLTRFSKLVRNVLENSNSEWVSIEKEMETLELYIEMELLRFDSKFTYEIHLDNQINPLLLRIPPLTIQPFVENAIIHGLLPLQNKQGVLTITMKKESDTLVCTIDDNGIGREKAGRIKREKESSYVSLGISITEERIHLFNKSESKMDRHTLTIQDKFENNEPSGTTVILTLPIQNLT